MAKMSYDYIMENDLKKKILVIVESARLAKEGALKPGGPDYAYVAGYASTSLELIYKLVKDA